MAKYHFAYGGGDSIPGTEAEQKAIMDAWIAWFGTLGESVVDGGNPFGPAKSVSGKGVSDGGVSNLGGYVDVYETFDVMM